MRSTRNRIGLLLLASASSIASITSAAGCASSAPVGITKSDAIVSGCQKIGDVAVDKKLREDQVNDALSAEARKQGANYVVVSEDGAHAGTAYRCSTPAVAAR